MPSQRENWVFTIKWDATVVLHGLDCICLTLKVNICSSFTATRSVVVYRCFPQRPKFCKQLLWRKAEFPVMFRTPWCKQSGFTWLSKLPWYPSQRHQSPDWKPAACQFLLLLHSGFRVHLCAPQTCHAAICLVTLGAVKSNRRTQHLIQVPHVLDRNYQRLDHYYLTVNIKESLEFVTAVGYNKGLIKLMIPGRHLIVRVRPKMAHRLFSSDEIKKN